MIDPALAQLLEPLERFEEVRRRAVRLGGRLCDLSYANPYDGASAGVREVLQAGLVDERPLALQYSPFGGQTAARRAAADALRAAYGLDFRYRDVVLTPGAMSALAITLHAVARPGGEVIIPVPCWVDYPLYARMVGLRPVLVPPTGETLDIDVEAVSAAVTADTCAVMLSQPANPTGRVHPPTTMADLGARLRQRSDEVGSPVTLISDETHRDHVALGLHTSGASHYDRTVIIYSFGKYHLMQGQRLGYAAVSPRHPDRDALAGELVRWTRITGIAAPTALMQRALPALLALRHPLDWLDRRRAVVTEALTAQGWGVVEPNATMFAYVAVPEHCDDWELTEALARKGVLVLPAPVFHHRGFFRIALTASDAMLERAVAVLAEHAP